ncbi:hypothetical protein NLJ89_g11498 [Agrocybe chaxingu]|uniref:Acyl-CoA dehydrogenase/oxidase N-terminal domain-containing protein n=1 Tax=Agrocybe chaxingu TaxID=84603 RepID=A0A9W8JLS9_9AGAR|nr:hypothetical protein NLJ89_g11498 [Agrocybe chaxingu]
MPIPVPLLLQSHTFSAPLNMPPRLAHTLFSARPALLLRSRSLRTPSLSLPLRTFAVSAHNRIVETTGFTDTQLTVRDAISQVCSSFPNTYWQECDQQEKDPKEFHAALAKDGWLGIALPEGLGGSGLGISEATMMMQTIAQSGAGMAGAQAIHANIYATQPLARFGTQQQLEETIPNIISGKWRTCFGVTEPNARKYGSPARRLPRR